MAYPRGTLAADRTAPAPRPSHPLGCHNPRVDDRRAMDAIFFVLRTGGQWNALNATGIRSSSAARRRFQEWTAAGVFVTLWGPGFGGIRRVEGARLGVAGHGRGDDQGPPGRGA